MLQRSVLLAVEASRRRPSVATDKVLRDGLVLLTPPIAEISYQGYQSSDLAFSPDGNYLAAPGRNNTARIWETTNWQEIQRLRHQGVVRAVAFSPDGNTLATASSAHQDSSASLWDMTTMRAVARLEHGWGALWSVSFSPGGSQDLSRVAVVVDLDAGGDATAMGWRQVQHASRYNSRH